MDGGGQKSAARQLNSELMIKVSDQAAQLEALREQLATHAEATARAEVELLIATLRAEEAATSEVTVARENARLRLENAELSTRAEIAEEKLQASEEQKGQLCKLVESLRESDAVGPRKPKSGETIKELREKLRLCELEKERWHKLWLEEHKPQITGRGRPLSEVTNHSLSTPTAKPGLRYEIPHKFVPFQLKGKTEHKCNACPLTITFKQEAEQCSDCGCTVHAACASSMPRTCGASEELLKQFDSASPHTTTLPANEADVTPPARTEVKVYDSGSKMWIDEAIEVQDGMIALSDPSAPRFDVASPIVSAESDPATCPTPLATSDRPCYVQLLSAEPCWPKVAVHLLFQNQKMVQQWLGWVKAQKDRSWAGKPIDSTTIPVGTKVVMAQLEPGQLGAINSAIQVRHTPNGVERVVIATDLGLYSCEEGSGPPRRVRADLTKVSAVVSIDQNSVLCIAGDNKNIFEVRLVTTIDLTSGCNPAPVELPGGGQFFRIAVASVDAGSTTRTAIGVSPTEIKIFRHDEGRGWSLSRSFAQQSVHVGSVSYLPCQGGGVFAIITDRFSIVDAAANATSRLRDVPMGDAVGRRTSWVFPMQAFVIGDEILMCDNTRGTFLKRDGSRGRTPALQWPNQPLGFSQLSRNQIAVSGWDSIIVYTNVGEANTRRIRVHSAPNLHLLGGCVWVSTEKTGSRVFTTRTLPEREREDSQKKQGASPFESRRATSMFGRGLPPFNFDSPVTSPVGATLEW